jgi:uncharacterized membrane protein
MRAGAARVVPKSDFLSIMNDLQFMYEQRRGYNASFGVIVNAIIAVIAFSIMSLRFGLMWKTLGWNPVWISFWWVFLVGSVIVGVFAFIYLRIIMSIQPKGSYGWFSRNAVNWISGWLESLLLFGIIVFIIGGCVVIVSFFR